MVCYAMMHGWPSPKNRISGCQTMDQRSWGKLRKSPAFGVIFLGREPLWTQWIVSPQEFSFVVPWGWAIQLTLGKWNAWSWLHRASFQTPGDKTKGLRGKGATATGFLAPIQEGILENCFRKPSPAIWFGWCKMSLLQCYKVLCCPQLWGCVSKTNDTNLQVAAPWVPYRWTNAFESQ